MASKPMGRTMLKQTSLVVLFSSCLTILPSCGQSKDLEPNNNSTQKTKPFSFDLGKIENRFAVSSIFDSGSGTLREAIQLANASPGTDKIFFKNEDGLYQQPQNILLNQPLPDITDNLIIDGFIKDMLWKASGITVDGGGNIRPFKIDDGVTAKITNLSITNGMADYGGGILNNGQLSVTGVTMQGNHAKKSGGAIANNGTILFIINSTLIDNSAEKYGGGLYNQSGTSTVTNATFTENRSEAGGAIYNTGSLSVANTILANSTSKSDCWSNTVFDVPENSNIVESSIGCGISFSSENPLLDEPNYYNGPTKTIPLAQRSPAINFGNNLKSVDEQGNPLTWDQRGNGDPRYVFGFTDIGAFELQPLLHPLTVDTTEDIDLRVCSTAGNNCSLRGAILIANNYDKLNEIFFDDAIFSENSEILLASPLPKIKADLRIEARGAYPVKISTRNIESKKGIEKENASINLQLINIIIE